MAIIFQGKPINTITLDQGKSRAQKKAELGYVLAKKHWGQGIATEAVKIALKKGFDDLSIDRVCDRFIFAKTR
jgi:RimJ/RimL family protein N-acetyltransferase